MIKTKAELMESLKVLFGESTDEKALSLIEDISDTVDDYEARTADSTNWKEKYEQNDKAWAEKYRNRFFSPVESESEQKTDETEKPLTYENLFEKGDNK